VRFAETSLTKNENSTFIIKTETEKTTTWIIFRLFAVLVTITNYIYVKEINRVGFYLPERRWYKCSGSS